MNTNTPSKTSNITLDLSGAAIDLNEYKALANEACHTLHAATGKGNDFLGWLQLPEAYSADDIAEIYNAKRQFDDCDFVVTIGIGGSYLGAKAVIEALNNQFDAYLRERKAPAMLFAGQNIGQDYLYEMLQLLKGKRFGIICISKSGTTTEPAIAFRLLKTLLEEQEGIEAAHRKIVCITDARRGALRTLANKEGYTSFVIEDAVGGRFSVLSPVGLLPIAVAGYDITALLEGARAMAKASTPEVPFEENIAKQYAAARYALYKNGKSIELLANFNPKLHYVAEWWKQLYGESEGKDGKGLFPASVDFTTDLHSMGQYIQDGVRLMFETVISVDASRHLLCVPNDETNLDGLNYLAGRTIDQVNKMAELGTRLAHIDGGVPNIKIVLPAIAEFELGALLYFFEVACGISGYMLDVNPFDQPGVEAYKRNMFALLEKPGYENQTAEIKQRLAK